MHFLLIRESKCLSNDGKLLIKAFIESDTTVVKFINEWKMTSDSRTIRLCFSYKPKKRFPVSDD